MFPRYGVHPGASPTVCFAAPPLDECGFAARRYAPAPRMNTFARPAEGAKKPDQKPDQEPLTLALSQRERGLTEVFWRATPTCNIESNSDFETDQKPLTALPRRERELIEVFGGATPTCNTESNSDFEKPKNRPPLPPGEGWGEGRIHHKHKADHAPLFTTQ